MRELRSVIDRAALIAEDGFIARDTLPDEISGLRPGRRRDPPLELATLTYREAVDRVRNEGVRRYLESLLQSAEGNVAAAAQLAAVERESFYRLCRRFGVDPAGFRTEARSRS
ncbi:MAG: hypothetical protein HYV09_35195 [Deltaproteobacteria bacterium]|nr:hypothetical protein [Deltaproteobacteria bacterium]